MAAMHVRRVAAVIGIVDDVLCRKAVLVAAAFDVIPAVTRDERRQAREQDYHYQLSPPASPCTRQLCNPLLHVCRPSSFSTRRCSDIGRHLTHVRATCAGSGEKITAAFIFREPYWGRQVPECL